MMLEPYSSKRDIVVIAASAGSGDALKTLVSNLPADRDAAVFVVQQLAPATLADALDQAGSRPARLAGDGQAIETGRIYVAPRDEHLLLAHDGIRLARTPRENGMRPSVDALFRSAAVCFGPRVVAVTVGDILADGDAGLDAVRRCGGLTLVQSGAELQPRDTPERAQREARADHALSLSRLASLMRFVIGSGAPNATLVPRDLAFEAAMAMYGATASGHPALVGSETALSCPECQSALWQLGTKDAPRFRCTSGHAFSAIGLLTELDIEVQRRAHGVRSAVDSRAALYRSVHGKRLPTHSRSVPHFAGSSEENERGDGASTSPDQLWLLDTFASPKHTPAQFDASRGRSV